jgi:virginiamycin B lyase
MPLVFRTVLTAACSLAMVGLVQVAGGSAGAVVPLASDASTVAASALPHVMVAPNGTAWSTDPAHDQILGLTLAGAVLRLGLPAGSTPVGITLGPDGGIWFTEAGADVIGRLDKSGSVSTFPVPTPAAAPWDITTMPGDLMAITERAAGKLAILKPDGGVVGEIPVGDGSTQPSFIATGPDGALYFTEAASGEVGQYNHESVRQIAMPSPTSRPTDITAGPDGAMWVSEPGADRVARVTTTGAVSEVALPVGAAPAQLGAGPDGAMWVAEPGLRRVARISGLQPATSLSDPSLSVHSADVLGSMSGLVPTADGALDLSDASSAVPTRLRGMVSAPTPCVAGPACVGVDTAGDRSELTNVANGYLEGDSDPAPSPQLVAALHPRSWRIDGVGQYPTAAANGSTITYLLSDGWYDGTYGKSSLDPNGQEPPWADPSGYTAYIKNTVSSVLNAGYRIDYWDVQNEPNKACCGTISQQLWSYRLAYEAIKSVAPTAKVMGPSLAGFADAPYPTDGVFVNQNSLDLRTFLQYAVAHDEKWDALSWHEIAPDFNTQLNSVDTPNAVADHIRRARQLVAEFPAAGNPVLVVNEYADQSQSAPGFIVGFDSAIDGSGLGLANMSCWMESDAVGPYSGCKSGAVDGLFLRGGTVPTPNYRVQKAYADLAGAKLPVTTTDPAVTGMASVSGATVRVLLGKHGGCHPLGRPCSSAASTSAPRATVVSLAMHRPATAYVVSRSLITADSTSATVTSAVVVSDAWGNLVGFSGSLADGMALSLTVSPA